MGREEGWLNSNFFFFSSRRRHTILQGDWSSDVCSSDLTKKILDKLSEKPATIIDFGCGTGTSIPLFLNWPGVTQVIGTDVSAKSLDVAIEIGRASCRERV